MSFHTIYSIIDDITDCTILLLFYRTMWNYARFCSITRFMIQLSKKIRISWLQNNECCRHSS